MYLFRSARRLQNETLHSATNTSKNDYSHPLYLSLQIPTLLKKNAIFSQIRPCRSNKRNGFHENGCRFRDVDSRQIRSVARIPGDSKVVAQILGKKMYWEKFRQLNVAAESARYTYSGTCVRFLSHLSYGNSSL